MVSIGEKVKIVLQEKQEGFGHALLCGSVRLITPNYILEEMFLRMGPVYDYIYCHIWQYVAMYGDMWLFIWLYMCVYIYIYI